VIPSALALRLVWEGVFLFDRKSRPFQMREQGDCKLSYLIARDSSVFSWRKISIKSKRVSSVLLARFGYLLERS
jgi:hypothetical protein